MPTETAPSDRAFVAIKRRREASWHSRVLRIRRLIALRAWHSQLAAPVGARMIAPRLVGVGFANPPGITADYCCSTRVRWRIVNLA